MAEVMKAARKVSQMMLSKKDQSHVMRAVEECNYSTMLMKHGCVVANGSKILACGHNHYRTRFNDGFMKQSCSCHAEMDALRKVTKFAKQQQSQSFKVRKKVGQRYEKVV
jgi:tRNA(Arg) A34 adenosine deaminase TadA